MMGNNSYTKYYTPEIIANSLIDRLRCKQRAVAIDICCGSGNLLKAFNNTRGLIHIVKS